MLQLATTSLKVDIRQQHALIVHTYRYTVPLLEPDTVDRAMTKRLLEEHNIQASASLVTGHLVLWCHCCILYHRCSILYHRSSILYPHCYATVTQCDNTATSVHSPLKGLRLDADVSSEDPEVVAAGKELLFSALDVRCLTPSNRLGAHHRTH